jgi:hypothetical protein
MESLVLREVADEARRRISAGAWEGEEWSTE